MAEGGDATSKINYVWGKFGSGHSSTLVQYVKRTTEPHGRVFVLSVRFEAIMANMDKTSA